jgi:hypothetical protein
MQSMFSAKMFLFLSIFLVDRSRSRLQLDPRAQSPCHVPPELPTGHLRCLLPRTLP